MKRYYAPATLVLLLIALFLGFSWKRSNHSKTQSLPVTDTLKSAKKKLESSWELGSRRVYRFDYRAAGEYSLKSDAPVAGKLSMTLSGTLSTTVVDNAGAARTLELRVVPKQLDVSGMPKDLASATLSRDLVEPFRVTYSRDGAVQTVSFRKSMDRQASTLLREIVSHLQVTLRPSRTWVALENEPSGQCLVSFQRSDEGHVSKQKQSFVKVTRSGKLVSPDSTVGVPKFTRSKATYKLDSGGRIMSAEIDHASKASVEVVSGSVESQVRASFMQVAESLEAVPAPIPLASRPVTDVETDAAPALDNERLPPTKEILASMRRANDRFDASMLHQAQDQLTRVVSRDPGALSAITDSDTSQPVLSAIGAAGSAEAQAELTRIASDPKQPDDVRRQAIDAFHEVQQATPESISELLNLADEKPETRENALLAAGGLINRKRAEDPELAAGWADTLAQRYERASSDAERAQLLDALGNSGEAAAFEILESVLASGSLELRIVAAKNLRLLPAPRADEMIGPLLHADLPPALREAAFFAASFRRFADMQAALTPILKTDPSSVIRSQALTVVATYLRRDAESAAEPLIRWVAENDPDAEVKSQAATALSPEKSQPH